MQPAQPLFEKNIAQTSGPSHSSEWFLDSGATHHVTHDLNNLSKYMPYEGFDALQIGDGTGMKICNIGSSSLSISNCTFFLNDILHVPSFSKNLLSLSKLLCDNSLLIEFYSTSCIIKERHTLRVLLQATIVNGLYMLPSYSPQAFFGERVSADLWHKRLGHPSPSTTSRILHSFTLPCTSKKISLCHDCCMAKAHKLPFLPSSSSTLAPLELVHSDV